MLAEFENMKIEPEKTSVENNYIDYIILIEPSLYRALDELLKKKLGGKYLYNYYFSQKIVFYLEI